MRHEDDYHLLRLYVERGSQEAFSELVQRYLRLVYSVCLRETRNATLAEDATQATFLVLAEKARSMREGVVLAGWLFNTARYAGRNAMRGETRREINEAKAVEEMAREVHQAEAEAWNEVEPHFEEALASLKAKDREAVLLRFFQQKSYKEVALAQGIAEDNARMRVARALDKLRGHLSKAGVAVTAVVLGELMMGRAAQAVPATCTAKVSLMISNLSSGAPAAAGAYQLSRGVLRDMFVSKVKVVAVTVAIAGVCAVGGKKVIRLASADDGATARGAAMSAPMNLSTPENTVLSFSQALTRTDLVAASTCVVGGRPESELAAIQGEASKKPDVFQISGVVAQTNGDTASVSVQELKEGPVDKSRPALTFGPQQIQLHRQGGQWKLIPATLDTVANQKSQPDFRLQLLATFLANPDKVNDLHYDDTQMACLAQLKQLAEASRQLSLNNNGLFSMDATNYAARIAPFLKNQDIWKCPLDKGDVDSYVFNDRLANISVTSIIDPASTVLFYEGRNGKLDFRHNGRACIAFADGHVQSITQDEANQVKVVPGA